MIATFSGDHLDFTQGALSVPFSPLLEETLFKRFIAALIMDQLLRFYSSVPFLYLNSLSIHSAFPSSLPLILLTALFAHTSQQLSKKQLWSIFSTTASAGDWWQWSEEKDLRQLGYKTYWVYKSVKYIKLLSWDQMEYCPQFFLCWSFSQECLLTSCSCCWMGNWAYM